MTQRFGVFGVGAILITYSLGLYRHHQTILRRRVFLSCRRPFGHLYGDHNRDCRNLHVTTDSDAKAPAHLYPAVF